MFALLAICNTETLHTKGKEPEGPNPDACPIMSIILQWLLVAIHMCTGRDLR